MNTFDSFGLTPALAKGIAELGFTEPTPVQSKVIPLLMKDGRDVVALAQTGTGKTAAFGLPMLQLTDPHSSATQGLILCPTRELCLQITRDLSDFGKFAPHLRILAVYGGSPISAQIRALHRGVHIIVATPGRMNDILRRGAARLDTVKRVVLDEADEMLNMGFQEELETILKEVPDGARTLLFSATMPRSVATIAAKYLTDPEEIIVGQRNAGAEKVTHECYMVHARDRYPALKRIIDALPGFYGIIFCRTRVETQDVAARLAHDGYGAEALHGDLSQDQRDRVMQSFRQRVLQILVATDVASRGLDVNDLTHVINYDLPGDPDVYTHRSGRTGRAGKAGISIVLVHMRENFKIRAIERLMNKRFENKQVPSGRQVCEAQLVAQLERIKQVDVSGGELAPYMPRINQVLAGLSQDEIVQRFVMREFGRFLTYYKDASELNQSPAPFRPARPDRYERPGGYERQDRSARPERPERRETGDQGRAPPEGFIRMRVNVGRMNNLTPAELISIINRATPGPMLRLGKIHIMEQSSVFEIAAESATKVLTNLNRAVYQERAVRAVAEGGEPRGDRPAPAARPHHFKKPGRPFHRPGAPAPRPARDE